MSPAFASANQNRTAETSYMLAIQQELARLDYEARCDTATGTCIYVETINNKGTTTPVNLHYSRQTQTVLISMERFLSLGNAAQPNYPLALKLLELNREMVTAKFEWDRPTNSIRLSTVLNTDSNFDRRAFRSLITGLKSIANRLHSELQGLLLPPSSDPQTKKTTSTSENSKKSN